MLKRPNKIPSKRLNDPNFLERVENQFRVKLPKHVTHITPEQYEEKEDKAYIARIVLDTKERGRHLILLINAELHTAEQSILNNTIRSTVQEGFIQGIASKLSFSREEQVLELSGKYQALTSLKDTLTFWIEDFKELERAIEEGKVEIVREAHAKTL